MEEIERANELTYFLWSMAVGAAMLVLYDFLRARRRERKLLGIFVYIEDAAWLALLAFLIYLLAFRENAGQIRWYSFFGVLLGGLVYKLTLGDRLMNLFRRAYACFVRILCFVVKIVFLPINLIGRMMKRPVGVVVWHSRAARLDIKHIEKTLCLRLKNRICLRRGPYGGVETERDSAVR